jgi:hypothetical protein
MTLWDHPDSQDADYTPVHRACYRDVTHTARSSMPRNRRLRFAPSTGFVRLLNASVQISARRLAILTKRFVVFLSKPTQMPE